MLGVPIHDFEHLLRAPTPVGKNDQPAGFESAILVRLLLQRAPNVICLVTSRQALRVSRAPVIASHSSARALAEHHRNVPDDVLKLVAQNGGVIMINFFPEGLGKASAGTSALGQVFGGH